jgi:predicted enzyme related to lactoylglutathione lyase
MAIGKLKTVVLDAPDIARLSAFYSELAGWTQQYADHEWITMTTDDGWRIGLQSAPDHVPPQWPDPSHPQQAHLDLRVPDLAAGTQKAVELGAELVRENERWNTLTDPAGHPFDLCLAQDETTTLMGVMLDCPDAKVLSAFYSGLLGKPVTYEGDGVAMIGENGDQPVMFQQIENYQAPQWPDPGVPATVPPRRDGRGDRGGRTGRAGARCDPARRRGRELARVRRPSRQAVLPALERRLKALRSRIVTGTVHPQGYGRMGTALMTPP